MEAIYAEDRTFHSGDKWPTKTRGVTYKECTFMASRFVSTHFKNVTFINCRFEDTNLNGLLFSGCIFDECGFSNVRSVGAVFNSTSFKGCAFVRTNFYTATLTGATAFTNCHLTYCELSHVVAHPDLQSLFINSTIQKCNGVLDTKPSQEPKTKKENKAMTTKTIIKATTTNIKNGAKLAAVTTANTVITDMAVDLLKDLGVSSDLLELPAVRTLLSVIAPVALRELTPAILGDTELSAQVVKTSDLAATAAIARQLEPIFLTLATRLKEKAPLLQSVSTESE